MATALVSEGRSDDEVLVEIAGRGLEALCRAEFNEPVDVSPVIPLRTRSGPFTIASVVEAVAGLAGGTHLVFFHRDHGTNDRVWSEWLNPMCQASGRAGLAEHMVPVVPVTETEAWLLADGEAFRSLWGPVWTDAKLGLPQGKSGIEGVADPKRLLAEIESQVTPTEHHGENASASGGDGVAGCRRPASRPRSRPRGARR